MNIADDLVSAFNDGYRQGREDAVVRGEWIEDGDIQICSNCGEEHSWKEYRASYCEDCGAKMEDKPCG